MDSANDKLHVDSRINEGSLLTLMNESSYESEMIDEFTHKLQFELHNIDTVLGFSVLFMTVS